MARGLLATLYDVYAAKIPSLGLARLFGGDAILGRRLSRHIGTREPGQIHGIVRADPADQPRAHTSRPHPAAPAARTLRQREIEHCARPAKSRQGVDRTALR